MAFTLADVEKLERAIATGALTVRFADRQVTYQSLDAMRKARREMLDEIAAANGTRRRRTFRVTQTGTGNG